MKLGMNNMPLGATPPTSVSVVTRLRALRPGCDIISPDRLWGPPSLLQWIPGVV